MKLILCTACNCINAAPFPLYSRLYCARHAFQGFNLGNCGGMLTHVCGGNLTHICGGMHIYIPLNARNDNLMDLHANNVTTKCTE